MFKVVRVERDMMLSVSLYSFETCCVRYALGMQSRAQFGYLYLFDTFANAKKWADDLPDAKDILILQCKAEETKELEITCTHSNCQRYKQFWGGELDDRFYVSVPRGTVGAKRCTPELIVAGYDESGMYHEYP